MVSKCYVTHLILSGVVIREVYKLFLAFIFWALHFTSPLKFDVVMWLSSANNLRVEALQVNVQLTIFPSPSWKDGF